MGLTMGSSGDYSANLMAHTTAAHLSLSLLAFSIRPVVSLVCGYSIPNHLALSVEPTGWTHRCDAVVCDSRSFVTYLALNVAYRLVLHYEAMSTTSHTPAVQDSSCEPVVLSSASYRDRSAQLIRRGISACSSSTSLALHSW